MSPLDESDAPDVFPEDARRALYDIVALRRDIRHFVPNVAMDEALLLRILGAAHNGPSVGFSQPWGFIVVRDMQRRQRVRENFLRCRDAESVRYPKERREHYLSYRLEGIVESSLNLCVTVDLRPRAEAILGTTAQPVAVRASVACAIQNLWLAARAEGIGIGWVSIVEPAVLRQEFKLPAGVHPVAYLCVGKPVAFRRAPMLEEVGWESRQPLAKFIHQEVWSEVVPQPALAAPPVEQSEGPATTSSDAVAQSREQQARLTKPAGSLGRLEQLAEWYVGARGTFPVRAPTNMLLALFLADHGVASEGVSAYSSDVTAAMACNVAAGGAAVNVLSQRAGVKLVAADVGIAGDLSGLPAHPVTPLRRNAVRAGTRDLRVEAAMSWEECVAAMDIGRSIAREAAASGVELAGIGEIGIGNTTAATALVAALTDGDPDRLCGTGTGVDETTRSRKAEVIRQALSRRKLSVERPVEALTEVGGLEIAAMVGFLLEAAEWQLPVVLDGAVTLAAALTAHAICPSVRPFLHASHVSPEPSFARAVERLQLRPLFDLSMRLGEGTGAILGMQLVAHGVALLDEIATFATAGVVQTGASK